jgi:hypothetical protein
MPSATSAQSPIASIGALICVLCPSDCWWLQLGAVRDPSSGFGWRKLVANQEPSWTKGGKARGIPVRTPEQRDVLDRAQRLDGGGSLIPSKRNYRQQLRVYERHTANAGLSKLHGLRHQYAQHRYEDLTGWKAPAAGGPPARTLSKEQRALDRETRLTISRELGHERPAVVVVY